MESTDFVRCYLVITSQKGGVDMTMLFEYMVHVIIVCLLWFQGT